MRIKIFIISSVAFILTITPVSADVKIKIKRNPFLFSTPKSKHVTRLQLILISNEGRAAIINGKRYEIGDIVGSYEIVSITLDYIQIANGKVIKRVFVNESIK